MNPTCFHCGLPVPDGADYPIRYRNAAEPACCAGCQAVAQTIVDAGLDDYYRHRSREADRAAPLPEDLLQQLRLYDDAGLQESFVRAESGTVREAALMLEGITCAACVWLNERHLLRQPGVLSVDINYTSHRARVRWDSAVTQLSDLLTAILAIGYRAHPYDAGRHEALAQKERKAALNRLWAAGLSMMQVMMYAVPIYLAPDHDIEPRFLWMLHWASCLLTIPVMVYSATPFYKGTLRDLRTRTVGMDTPVTLGILVSFFASSWALLQHNPHGIYFDSVSMFVFLLLGGRYLEGMARRKAGEATESLVKMLPAFAHRLTDWPASDATEEIPVARIAPGHLIEVRPGETVPADGEVVDGRSKASEALLTGEGRPVPKQAGSFVIAGSQNIDSPLRVRVTRSGGDTRIAGIVRLLDHALAEKPRLARLADRFARQFVALLLLAALATYAGWYFIDPDRALWVTVAVLVVTCPCALSLATPAALTAAAGHLARRGVLVTRGHAIETLARIDLAVFDKTGTLTHGDMRLAATRTFMPAIDVHALAGSLERGASHPLARAFPDGTLDIGGKTAVQGQGMEGLFDGTRWRLGRPDWVAALSGAVVPPHDDWHPDCTIVALGSTDGLAALFAIGDTPRDDAPALVAALRAAGIDVHLLSGDADSAVSRLAARLGIRTHVAAATPEDKLAYVAARQAEGRRVLMVGDGVNDAPVLARADVSLAMEGGTDVACASADMVLMQDRILQIPAALALSRKTLGIIRQNLWWAALYNLVALPLAATGHVTPWLASLGMALSSLLVVSNALRLTPGKR